MLNWLVELAVLYLNLGLVLGLTFGALILLRPLTGRLLRPQHQVMLWYAGWLLGVLATTYSSLGRYQLLPVTFRSLVVPRVAQRGGQSSYPAFFWSEAGTEVQLMLPGGTEVAIPRYGTLLTVLALVWLVTVVGVVLWENRQERRLKRLSLAGERMDRSAMAEYGITDQRVAVRLCENLPTSFVRRGHDTGRKDGIRYVICLQKELHPERMRLVLLHEMGHIRLHHPAYKGLMVGSLTALYWWNPILWLACRLTCRDMELACDAAVLEKLEPAERRDYARTLVELASGKHLWGSVTSFGECDAALRVRRAARWKPVREELEALSLLLASVLFVFFFCGGPVYQSWKPAYEPPRWPEYLESGAWMDQVAQKLEQPDWQPREVWSKRAEALVVLDETGQWYSISFSDWTGEKYDWVSVGPMRQAFLDGYTRVS